MKTQISENTQITTTRRQAAKTSDCKTTKAAKAPKPAKPAKSAKTAKAPGRQSAKAQRRQGEVFNC